MNYICEYCNNLIIEKYASGRFCNKSCAKGFSTKKKRKEINIKVSKKLTKLSKKEITYEIVNEAISSTLTIRSASIKANIPYKTFINKAKIFGLYKTNQGGKGKQKLKLEEILSYSEIRRKGEFIKPFLFKNNLKQEVCENCGISNWCNKPITLELEHIDGNNKNNRLENLKILCPNCHSQTPTYRRKKSSLGDMLKLVDNSD